MQIKATVRVYYTLTLECNKTDIFSTNHITLWLWTCFSIPIKCKLIREWEKKNRDWKEGWWWLGAAWTLIHSWGECRIYRHFEKQYSNILQINIYLTHDWTIPLLGIYPRTVKIYIHIKTCIQKFITAWFIIAKNSMPSKCPSSNEW